MPLELSKHGLTKQHFALGTGIELSIFGTTDTKILDDSCQLIDDYEDTLTVNREISEVMDINYSAGKEPAQVSVATYQLVKTAVEESKKHEGFNAAIGPLVKLWHIGFKDARVPADVEIQETRQLVNPDNIICNDLNQTVFLPEEGMELDLGGIGKGFIADRIQDFWRSKGIESGIINLGGNILLLGKNPMQPDGLWRIGIRDPLEAVDKEVAILTGTACSAVTSGIAERRLEVDGKTYHHIIDPETGYPHDNDVASVTIFSKYSIDAEIETTRLFFADGAPKNWPDRPDIYGAVIAYRDKSLEFIGIPPHAYRIVDPDYHLKKR